MKTRDSAEARAGQNTDEKKQAIAVASANKTKTKFVHKIEAARPLFPRSTANARRPKKADTFTRPKQGLSKAGTNYNTHQVYKNRPAPSQAGEEDLRKNSTPPLYEVDMVSGAKSNK